jgi:hypothetical protein
VVGSGFARPRPGGMQQWEFSRASPLLACKIILRAGVVRHRFYFLFLCQSFDLLNSIYDLRHASKI